MDKKTKNIRIQYDIQLNDEQNTILQNFGKTPFLFLTGGAGTGKTLAATYLALNALFKKQCEQIIITRPTVSTEENGFLPGTLEEKLEPWLQPIRSNLRKVYNHVDKLKKMEAEKQIEIISLQHFRGVTFDNAVCIIDEFQNLTTNQLKMAIGRLGKNSIMIFCGDYNQIDLKQRGDSAIYQIEKIKNSNYVNITDLTVNHRHPAITELLNLI